MAKHSLRPSHRLNVPSQKLKATRKPSPAPTGADETSECHPQALITLRNVSVRAGERICLKGINWTIHRGEQWAIIGPNGSGKSQLAKVIAGEAIPAKGELEYCFAPADSEVVPEDEVEYVSLESHRALAELVSEYHQARWVSFEGEDCPTVRAFLGVSPRARGNTQAELDTFVRRLEMEALLDRRLIHLSNGETRKVLLIRALLARPRLLIFDDPYAGLDAHSRQALRGILGDLMRQGFATLLVSRTLDELPDEISHLMCVDNGRGIARGPKEEILSDAELAAHTKREPGVTEGKPCLTLARRAEPRNSPEILVRLRNINVAYDGVHILRGINWTIRAGEHWALLGPNGSGKSTLLSLILADNPQAYASDIELFGSPRGSGESIWDIKERIGWVAPEMQVFYDGDSTCKQVVCSGFFDSIGLYQRCSPHQYRTAHRWLHDFGLERVVDAPFHSLSEGQQRMALIARALVKNPLMLILDEPCAGLDEAHRRVLLDLVNAIGSQTDTTILFVTHHEDEIPPCITHALRLRKGRVLRRGALAR
ncbi:MAG: ATP-binding cassette domain-containing protein [Candidatus Hydrogenedentes bacterium]|nr:ATP-binding cassette domain-containing protein [Candidatus Hydrogenedentota bacterium]